MAIAPTASPLLALGPSHWADLTYCGAASARMSRGSGNMQQLQLLQETPNYLNYSRKHATATTILGNPQVLPKQHLLFNTSSENSIIRSHSNNLEFVFCCETDVSLHWSGKHKFT